MSKAINIGFVPLTDAAPLILAVEMGFAEEEGLSINLVREHNWSSVRDKLSFGVLDGAHILLPMALAMSLGLAPAPNKIDIPIILNMNGNSFVAGNKLTKKIKAVGGVFGKTKDIGEALITLTQESPIRVAVPFLQSMHVTMLRHLISQLGHTPETVFDFHVCAPSSIEMALNTGNVDAFMVGAPWATNAIDNGSGHLMLTSNSIWQGAPEKAFGIRRQWLDEHRNEAEQMVRVLYRAANWVSNPSNASVASEILSNPKYLDLDTNHIESNLRGDILVKSNGMTINEPLALQFDAKRIGFPWKSTAAWIAEQNAPYWGVSIEDARTIAREACRTDIYRSALESVKAPLPSANEKVEGSLKARTSVSGFHEPIFGPDAFFDGITFDVA
ncbi:CmpA/NrtA family ABC transporter substrate-binding protein [Amylibacter sp. SFDW26]|uniref:CmpA/NrtA family ABC transporter substrate-binding protein n=1 Tax=Amylibacter sp. SFDW26 TaxID=2652722 RepID=UPI00186A0B2F|nr:CmpA/NrtA family ABC transporter substrate-binding protein [Amylibacter sp. SFDW26]